MRKVMCVLLVALILGSSLVACDYEEPTPTPVPVEPDPDYPAEVEIPNAEAYAASVGNGYLGLVLVTSDDAAFPKGHLGLNIREEESGQVLACHIPPAGQEKLGCQWLEPNQFRHISDTEALAQRAFVSNVTAITASAPRRVWDSLAAFYRQHETAINVLNIALLVVGVWQIKGALSTGSVAASGVDDVARVGVSQLGDDALRLGASELGDDAIRLGAEQLGDDIARLGANYGDDAVRNFGDDAARALVVVGDDYADDAGRAIADLSDDYGDDAARVLSGQVDDVDDYARFFGYDDADDMANQLMVGRDEVEQMARTRVLSVADDYADDAARATAVEISPEGELLLPRASSLNAVRPGVYPIPCSQCAGGQRYLLFYRSTVGRTGVLPLSSVGDDATRWVTRQVAVSLPDEQGVMRVLGAFFDEERATIYALERASIARRLASCPLTEALSSQGLGVYREVTRIPLLNLTTREMVKMSLY